MSNARSPREVCSTTIGTSGLTVFSFFRVVRSVPSDPSGAGVTPTPPNSGESSNGHRALRRAARGPGGPVSGLGPRLLGAGREGQVARLGVLDADGVRALRDHVEGLRVGDVLLERVDAPGGADALQQLLR